MKQLFPSRLLCAWVALTLAGTAPSAQAETCTLVPNLLFSYPSAERALVRPDDVFWVVGDFGTGSVEVSLDGARIEPRGESPPESWQFQPPELTPGAHELQLTLRHIGDQQEPERLTLPFAVAASGAPASGDGQALPQSVRYYPAFAGSGPVELATRELQEQLLMQEGDCSELVQRQWPGAGCGDRPGHGLVRLEFDARGDVLGFYAQGFFLPAGCRAAFLPEFVRLPVDIYPVTAAGLGEQALFEGEIQLEQPYVPPPVDIPAAPAPEAAVSASSCALPGKSGPGAATAGILLALGAALAARRRKALR